MTKKAEQQEEAGGEVQQEMVRGSVRLSPLFLERNAIAAQVLGAIVGSPDMMNTVRKQATGGGGNVAAVAAGMAVDYADALIDRLAK